MEKRIVELVKLALLFKASDIHLTLRQDEIKIEIRVMDEFKKVKTNIQDFKLIRYLQYIAKLDVGNNLKPQTGQFELYIDNELISLRFSLINNLGITNAVIRILNPKTILNIYNLNIFSDEVIYFEKLLNLKEGLVLFSGPTGSGKTTTLYTILESFSSKKIISIEDPIEVYKDQFLQLQINEQANFDYNAAIKQILRHDPDIIMIGEIRDEIAAKAAIRAANTGHLVLSSIHASNCEVAIKRLLDLGVKKHQLQVVLKQVYNQRLFKTSIKQKGGIYEIFDEQQLQYFFKNNCTNQNFISISKKIEQAKKEKKIEV